MRKSRKYTLWALWSADPPLELQNQLQESFEGQGLTYQDFGETFPELEASSWRVILNRLVQEKLVLKQRQEGRLFFRLTRLGHQEVRQQFFQSLFGEETSQLSLVIIHALEGLKTNPLRASRILEQAGYRRLMTGVYYQAGEVAYSDFFWQSLRREGFLALSFPVNGESVKPVPLSSLWLSEINEKVFQAEAGKTSTRLSNLLTAKKEGKYFDNRAKAAFGKNLVSGLSVLQSWQPFLQGGSQSSDLATRLLSLVFEAAKTAYQR